MSEAEALRSATIFLALAGGMGAMVAASGYTYFRLGFQADRRQVDRLLPLHIWCAATGYLLIGVAKAWQAIELFHEPLHPRLIVSALGFLVFDTAILILLKHTKKRSEESTQRRIQIGPKENER